MYFLKVLRSTLSIESACRSLIYADMYNSHDLKLETIRFIAQNSTSIIKVLFRFF